MKPFNQNSVSTFLTVIIILMMSLNITAQNHLANQSKGLIRFVEHHKYGFKDSTGKIIVNPTYDNALDFKEGYASVTMGIGHDSKSGYIDCTGNLVIGLNYANAGNFSEGLAPVMNYGVTDGRTNYAWQKHSFIDTSGNVIIDLKSTETLKYYVIGGFSQGLAAVGSGNATKGYKCGFINKKGEVVIELRYYGVGNFSEGLASIILLDNKDEKTCGFIDTTGKIVIYPKYSGAEDFSNGLANVMVYGEKNGKIDYSIKKHGLIDKTGRVVLEIKYDLIGVFNEGMALICIVDENEKFTFGFIDLTGKVIIPVKYDSAEKFINGQAKVTLNEETFFIDKQGNRIK